MQIKIKNCCETNQIYINIQYNTTKITKNVFIMISYCNGQTRFQYLNGTILIYWFKNSISNNIIFEYTYPHTTGT